MQTFLPYPSFERTARCLDRRRLGKQRVEACQILTTLLALQNIDPTTAKLGWARHPAVLMWRGYEGALHHYATVMCCEWAQRGYRNERCTAALDALARRCPLTGKPPWLGRRAFHQSHRSNLLRKDPEYYSQFGWTVGPDLPYVWPVAVKK